MNEAGGLKVFLLCCLLLCHFFLFLFVTLLAVFESCFSLASMLMKFQSHLFQTRKVELKTRADTPDISNLQKCADFVHAFMLGFDVIDAVALLRLDDLFVDSFEIKDVKTLRGEHLSRAIGRLSGKGGRTKFAIENATKTRIVIADTKIHILGTFLNIKVARDSLCSLILGSPAGKVYSKLRAVTSRLAENF